MCWPRSTAGLESSTPVDPIHPLHERDYKHWRQMLLAGFRPVTICQSRPQENMVVSSPKARALAEEESVDFAAARLVGLCVSVLVGQAVRMRSARPGAFRSAVKLHEQLTSQGLASILVEEADRWADKPTA
jgi:hypothetical protein